MPWYQCLIRGENFPGELMDLPGLVGFYVTRFIQAPSAEDAESEGVRALKADPALVPPGGHEPRGIAKVYFEEITQIESREVPSVQPGFTWYPMESAE